MKFIILIPTLLIIGCAVQSGYQSKMVLPDGTLVQTPKDGEIIGLKIDKTTTLKDGTKNEAHFSADSIRYGVNSNAVAGASADLKTVFDGVQGVIKETTHGTGEVVGQAFHTTVTGGAP